MPRRRKTYWTSVQSSLPEALAGIGAAGFAAIPQPRAELHWPSGQFNRDCGLLVSVVGDDLALRKGNRPEMETQNTGVAGDPNVIKLGVRDIVQLFKRWTHRRFGYGIFQKAETTAIRTLFRDGRRAFLIGMSLLAACLFFAWRLSQGYQGPFARLMQESLVIIGWVVIWRPIEIFLYDWIPLVRRRKLYRRLAASKVTAVSATRPS
jgi:hypothetical protein